MTYTKEDYRNALESFERNLRAYDYEPDIEAILTLKNCEVIKSALQLAIDLQPRPIEEAKPDEMYLVYCPDRGITNEERFEYVCAYNKRGGSRHGWATHFYDLSALTKPDGE